MKAICPRLLYGENSIHHKDKLISRKYVKWGIGIRKIAMMNLVFISIELLG